MINPKTRVASLRGEVSNPNGLLKPEMFVKGTHETAASSGKGVLTVPKSAVLWTGTRSVVYVADIDASVPSFEYREITLGEGQGNHYVVLDGLEAGEEVVVNGAFVIDAAAQLNNQASMMNRNVRLTGEVSSGPDYQRQTPEVFRQQLMDVVKNYMNLKDALVASDAPEVTKQASGVEAALKSVDMGLLSGDAHLYWMEKLNAMKSHLDKIVTSPDIEEQRKQFSFVTDALVDALTAFGVSGDPVYLQHCPMAFDNTGADWLSMEKAIRNPYFGDKMLKCGSVKTTFAETGSTHLPSNSSKDQHQN
jgi:Cu(I)/Ag(I) efflux system membrane fusion protein